MESKKPLFKAGSFFHVYNHGNADENIFREKENYYYFLKRYANYIYPIAKTYAFCLMPNHFHFAVKIRSEFDLKIHFEQQDKDLIGLINLSGLVSQQFSNFTNSYTKSFNNKYNRKGKLFLKSLHRKPINNKTYFKNLIYYIHRNPVHHGFVSHPSEWSFSSYHIILSKKETHLDRNSVLNLFYNKDSFVKFHKKDHPINRDEFY